MKRYYFTGALRFKQGKTIAAMKNHFPPRGIGCAPIEVDKSTSNFAVYSVANMRIKLCFFRCERKIGDTLFSRLAGIHNHKL